MKTTALILWVTFAAWGFAGAAETPANSEAAPPGGGAHSDASLRQPSAVQDTNGFVGDTTAEGVRLNFRGAPLDTVLNYLSQALGFIIVYDTDVKGTVDVVSAKPLNKDEVIDLLNDVLSKNGCAALVNGRKLTIVSNEDAKRTPIPVRYGNNPTNIPLNDQLVTQVLPVGTLAAAQLAKDLEPLLSKQATLTPNEAGNALIMTDTGANVHHLAEIIKALDSTSVSSVKVFQLKYSDAKSVASELKDIFTPSTDTSSSSSSSRGGDMRSYFRMRFGGGGGEGGDQGGGAAADHHPSSGHVTAVADDNSNSVIVSAPDDEMPMVEKLINEIDGETQDPTEVRVFKLVNADPSEMADLLGNLFPDPNKTEDSTSSRSAGYRFSSFFGMRPSSSSTAAGSGSQQSDRMKRTTSVLAVADRRTSSLVVTASKEMMVQIAAMVKDLDSSTAGAQHVYSISLENADVADVLPVLQDLFPSTTSRSSSSTSSTTSSPLMQRENNNATQQNSSTSTSGFGSGSTGASALH